MDKGMEKISMGYGYGQGEGPDVIRELENDVGTEGPDFLQGLQKEDPARFSCRGRENKAYRVCL